MTKLPKLLLMTAFVAGLSLLSGCAFLTGAAVGGAAVYVLH